ncbi:MAG TPA: PAS domain S-box protein [Stellaceae bacterium]|nr:PAS domain S-box protein [Stellaceae bacterium]
MSADELAAQNAALLRRLEEAEETLRAIREGAVDAFVVEEATGSRIYTLEGADRPYRILIEQMQQGAALLNPDGTIAYCNRSLAEMLGLPLERLAGVPLRELVAPPHRAALAAALQQALFGRSRCEVDLHRTDGVLVPVYLGLVPLFEGAGAAIAAILTDLTGERSHTELVAAHQALRTSEERLRHILDSAVEYAIIALDENGRINNWNAGAERLLGYRESEILGHSAAVLFTAEDQAAGVPARKLALARSEGRAENERWHVRRDGSRFWGSGVMLPITSRESGGFLDIIRDRTAEVEAERNRQLLVEELNHRVKNTLAAVQSLAVQSQAGGGWESFEARLLSLSQAHELLTEAKWEGASLRALMRRGLEPWLGERTRIAFDGPDVRLGSKAIVALAMALHELATNAVKYGALSTPSGNVRVTWEVTPGSPDRLRLQWAETGGPPVSPPARRGFGSRLIERGLALDLGGEARLDFATSGLVCTIEIPLNAPPDAQ